MSASERRGVVVWIRSRVPERRVEGLRVASGLAVWSENETVSVVCDDAVELPGELAAEWTQHLGVLLEHAADFRVARTDGAEWPGLIRTARVVLEF